MPTEIKALHVFLASPAGLEDERSAVDDVVKRINSVIEPVFNICLHLFRSLIINLIRTPPTFIRTCADECGNPIP